METVDYTVRRGNTLFGIAQFFRTTVDKILEINDIDDPNMIYVGQTLKIPADTESEFVYVTRPGDTLWKIAQRYNTTVKDLVNKNSIFNSDIIYPGTRLYI